MIKKILEQFDKQFDDCEDTTDKTGSTLLCTVESHHNEIKHFLITTHIQQLEEEIEELEGMKKSVLENVLIGRNDELFEKHGVDGVKGHNQAIEDLITLKQQQIQEAKELLNNK